MQYTIMLWHADHVNFARLLNLLEGELDLLHDAGSPHYQLMLDIMYYMTHYSDVLHHPKEDLVCALERARRNVGRRSASSRFSTHNWARGARRWSARWTTL